MKKLLALAVVLPLTYWLVLSINSGDVPPMPRDQACEQVGYIGDLYGRSGRWPTVRDQFARLHPVCEACGSKEDLNVHHVEPYHLDPSLELDPENLISLCRKHHFELGHLRNWQSSNPNVREDVEAWKLANGKK